jgi:hypothetical protein
MHFLVVISLGTLMELLDLISVISSWAISSSIYMHPFFSALFLIFLVQESKWKMEKWLGLQELWTDQVWPYPEYCDNSAFIFCIMVLTKY